MESYSTTWIGGHEISSILRQRDVCVGCLVKLLRRRTSGVLVILIPVHVNLGSHVQKVVKELVKAPATNPPAKDLEVYTVNIGQIPPALASWITGAINSGSFCRIDPDMETWMIPKQKLLDIAESKSSWLDMALYFFEIDLIPHSGTNIFSDWNICIGKLRTITNDA
ncbi:hypothetical protein YC2023_020390 [Brassica napus]